ncbi:MAG: tetrathionate reductase family octaheme c-type cytochrome [Chloroflexi bacterium CFX4]|nr:tetrathionate reductase family octaheme c-type cytochrome [Chloroflexi bacterium CFX4]MDL1922698.1 tetrathionate reductase family octaheme c-type cytochrome [Chloroflexi bacterium CFX3]
MLQKFRYIWLIGLGVTLLIIGLPMLIALRDTTPTTPSPWQAIRATPQHVSHAALINGDFKTGSEVTRACLTCHAEAGQQMLHSVHFTWQAEPVVFGERDQPIGVGKINLLNNFCIGIQSNWTGCTKCHAGYGWQDANYDFTNVEQVDCLVCHDQSGTYLKAAAGQPAQGVDLLVAARSVGAPTRQNCGSCHFNGGGGNAVKHGDLDESMYFPNPTLDVHMGKLNFECTTCHVTTDHIIGGRSLTSSADVLTRQIGCTDCHAENTHQDARLNAHTDSVACQTCHIPAAARRNATKMLWDWSTAGQDLAEDPHHYLKIKGSFEYEQNFVPQYFWFNGLSDRYLLGDPIDPSLPTVLNPLAGSINDPNAKIYPFKVHLGNQPYDKVYNYLLQPNTVGGYWVHFDWDKAFVAGAQATGLAYSGQYGFAPTVMYYMQTHQVAPKADALQCADCHGESTRLDWQALGYMGDPLIWGGRK